MGQNFLTLTDPNGYDCQPPTVPAAQLAPQDLTSLLHPPSRKLNGQKARDALSKTLLDPDTLVQLEDIWNFLWWYCNFDANNKPKSLSAGFWIKASLDVADYKTKGPWQGQMLRSCGLNARLVRNTEAST